MFVYVNLGYYQWQDIKRTGVFGIRGVNDNDECGQAMIDWLVDQLHKRLPPSTRIDKPIYTFMCKPPVHDFYPAKRVICKVKIDDTLVVPFDDNTYLYALNSINNDTHSFCAWSEEEDVARRDASKQECMESYKRMFKMSEQCRSNRWVSPVEPRAFIPFLTRDMVKKVWIYRNAKRLRKK